MPEVKLSSDFLTYLASQPGDGESQETRLPPLRVVSEELGLSVAALREQLEVAKAIGLVEVRPRTGIRRLPYSFFPAVRESLSYAIALDWDFFIAYSDLRNHIESVYWSEAVHSLAKEDHIALQILMEHAWDKLHGSPIQIPHDEHRQLHLRIYSSLNNPFVMGLLEAYWEAYEAVGLNLFADYAYLQRVWEYHQEMVDAIGSGNIEQGYQALASHKDLLFHRPNPSKK